MCHPLSQHLDEMKEVQLCKLSFFMRQQHSSVSLSSMSQRQTADETSQVDALHDSMERSVEPESFHQHVCQKLTGGQIDANGSLAPPRPGGQGGRRRSEQVLTADKYYRLLE